MSKLKRSYEYDLLYEQLVEKYGTCPVETLWKIMMDPEADYSVKVNAAGKLTSLRFPTKKAVDLEVTQPQKIEIVNPNEILDMEPAERKPVVKFPPLDS